MSVRLEAAIAMGFREMTDVTLKAQKNAFLNGKDVNVRSTLLRNIWQSRLMYPEAKLVKGATKDSVREVRKAAADLINTH